MSEKDSERDIHNATNQIFGDSDDSDEMDLTGLSSATKKKFAKDITVKPGNKFKVLSFESQVTANAHLIRLPAAFGIQEKPFDKFLYDDKEEQDENKELSIKQRISRSEALIRWRWKRDSNGNLIRDARGKPIRESNARIVKWSDGSYQLMIGNENVFDLNLEDNAQNNQYIASCIPTKNVETEEEEKFMQIESHLDSRITFNVCKAAPVDESSIEIKQDVLDYTHSIPDRHTSGKGRSTVPRRSHVVKDKEMNNDFLENNDSDDENNLSKIKSRGKSGYYNYESDNGSDGE